MRINTKASIALAQKVYKQFGSWAKVYESSERANDGRFLLNSKKDVNTHENS